LEAKQLRRFSVVTGIVTGRAAEAYCGVLLLAVARRSVRANLDGLGYVDMVPFHRAVGWWCVAMVTLHSLAFSADYLIRGGLEEWLSACLPFFPDPEESMNTLGLVNFFGLASLLFAIALGALSIPRVRRVAYDKFYAVHIMASVGFVIFASLHYLPWLWFSLPGIAFYAHDRWAARRSRSRPERVRARILSEGSSSCIALLTWSQPSPGGLAPGHRWVSVCAPGVSAQEWHPFSVIQHRGQSHVMIKGLGDWSRSLCRLLSSNAAARVRVEGPFGRTVIKPGRGARSLLLIAGGVGVAPHADLLCGLQAHGCAGWERITLLWAVRHSEYTAMTSACVDLAAMSRSARVLVFVTDREMPLELEPREPAARSAAVSDLEGAARAHRVKTLHSRVAFVLACLPAVACVAAAAWSFRPLLRGLDPYSTNLTTFTIFKRAVPEIVALCLDLPVVVGLALAHTLLSRAHRGAPSSAEDPDARSHQLCSGACPAGEGPASDLQVRFSKPDLHKEMALEAEAGILDVHVCGPSRMTEAARQGARTLRKAGLSVRVDVHDPDL